jgi:hypothetical protein
MARAPEKYLLAAPKFCGRGVEIRRLSRPQKDAARDRAIGELQAEGADADYVKSVAGDDKFRRLWQMEMLRTMLVGVTRKDGYTSPEQLDEAEWEPLTSEKLQDATSPYHYDKLFGEDANDHEVLTAILNEMHGISKEELDRIVGKAPAAFKV